MAPDRDVKETGTAQPDAESPLDQSEARLRAILETVIDGIVTIDERGSIESVNPAVIRMFGYAEEELLGRNVKVLMPAAYAGEHDSYLSNYLRTGDKKIIGIGREVTGRRKDGSTFPMYLGVSELRLAGQRKFTGILRDISMEKEAAEALRIERDFATGLIRTAPVIVLLIDLEGRILSFNPFMEALSGYSLDEVKGKDWFTTFLPERFWPETRDVFENALSGVRTRGNVTPIVGRNGEEREIEWYDTPLLDAENQLSGLLAIGHDVSERRRAERELRRSEEQLRSLTDAAPLLIACIARSGRFEFVNRSFEDWFERERSTLLGQTFAELLGAQAYADVSRHVEAVLAGEVTEFQALFPGPSGGRHVAGTLVPRFDESGQVGSFVTAIADVSAMKRMEDELLQSQKMEAVGRLAGGIAHDFNNLLMGILGCSRIATGKLATGSEARPFIEEIGAAAERGVGMTRQLLDFSRKRDTRRLPVKVQDVLSAAREMVRQLLGESIRLKTVLSTSEDWVLADPSQIEQVLINLVINARDAMPGGGELSIETHEVTLTSHDLDGRTEGVPGEFVLVQVQDTGIGMDERTRSLAFEPFFTTKPAGEGTGLGLSSVYGIVQQLGGFVRLESRLGEGSTFRLYLPRIMVSEEDGPQKEGAALAKGSGETILVVEDNKLVRLSVVDILDKLGYEILEAADPVEALELLQHHSGPLHLLLTDVVLPGMDGSELAGRICAQRDGLGVLFMSAYPGDLLVEQGRLGPGQQAIQKPFTEEDLAVRVRTLLDADE